MRTFVLLFLTILSSQTIIAVPTDGKARDVIQIDGTILTLSQYGDEHFHFLMTKDGLIVKEVETGGYYYAIIEDDQILPSKILAHNPEIRNKSENQFVQKRLGIGYDTFILNSIREPHKQMINIANKRRARSLRRSLGEPVKYVGEKKGLVILVNFPNMSMKSSTANDDYVRMFNEVGYSDNNHVGSVHDYFFDQSYGMFNLTFDVVGPVTVSNNYGYYGSDALNGNNDLHVREMITEACILADEHVNYNNYDWDHDGIVDQVYIIYAGYGQATGGPSNTIWPHESYLTENLVLDSKIISQYACSNELYKGNAANHDLPMGIGTACHEFSHCLGLPDLYDTDYSGAYGMSYWSLMNSGSYSGPNGVGEVPYGYSAYERWFAGWLDFIELNTSQKVEQLPSLEDNPIAYKVVNNAHQNEFFIIENHQPNKWFSFVSTYSGIHGLLITHLDYDKQAWVSNNINPSIGHQRMSPIVADNNYTISFEGLAGDLFPGKANVTALTNTSHVNFGGKLFNSNSDGNFYMNKSILNIKEDNGNISFDVIYNDELPTPTALEAADITQHSFIARWTSMNENIESYTLELEKIKSYKPFVSEIILIDSIKLTEYHVECMDLYSCKYRVRANMGNLHTEWSNSISVSLSGINDIIPIQFEIPTDSPTYSLDGVLRGKLQKGNLYIRKGHLFINK